MCYVPDPPLNQLSELPARCERVSLGNTFGRLAYCAMCFYFRATLEIVRDGLKRGAVAENNGRLYNVSFSNKARCKWLYVLRNNTEGLLIATTFRMNFALHTHMRTCRNVRKLTDCNDIKFDTSFWKFSLLR